MLDEKTFKKEIVRMWDTLRGDEDKGKGSCNGVCCGDCPLSTQDDFVNDTCTNNINAFKVIKIVERWSKEHPPKKHKVSQLEYDILKSYLDYKNHMAVDIADYFFEDGLLLSLLKKGHFKGATKEMLIKDYLNDCEVKENDDN